MFTPSELAAIETVLPRFSIRDVAMYRVATATALRIAEILQLRLSDCWRNGSIRSEIVVTRAHLKGGKGVHRSAVKSRTLPVSDSLRPVLEELVFALAGSAPSGAALEQPLFQGRGGRPLSRRQATYRLRALLLEAGLTDRSGYGWHCARRTVASAVYEQTSHDLNLTRYILGHAHLETTRLYLPEDDLAASRVLSSLRLPGAVAAAADLRTDSAQPKTQMV